MRNERFENSGTSNETTSTSQLVRYGHDRLVLLQLLRTYGAGFTTEECFFRETGRPFKKISVTFVTFFARLGFLPPWAGLRDAHLLPRVWALFLRAWLLLSATETLTRESQTGLDPGQHILKTVGQWGGAGWGAQVAQPGASPCTSATRCASGEPRHSWV